MLHWGAISSFRRFPGTGADNLPEVLCILQPSCLLSSSYANSENTRSAPRHGAILGTRICYLPVRLVCQYILLAATSFARFIQNFLLWVTSSSNCTLHNRLLLT